MRHAAEREDHEVSRNDRENLKEVLAEKQFDGFGNFSLLGVSAVLCAN
jgi:hypothetical protein